MLMEKPIKPYHAQNSLFVKNISRMYDDLTITIKNDKIDVIEKLVDAGLKTHSVSIIFKTFRIFNILMLI